MIAYSDFAISELVRLYPELESQSSKSVLQIAADAYLFRFDTLISVEYVEKCLSRAFHYISKVLNTEVADARIKCLRSFSNSIGVYFAEEWSQVDAYVEASTPRLHSLRKRYRAFVDYDKEVQRRASVVEVKDTVTFDAILESELPVLVKFYADYCSICKRIAPKFEAAADSLAGCAVFCAVNGPENPNLVDRCKIMQYPAVVKFMQGKQIENITTPHKLTVKGFMSLAIGKDECERFIENYEDTDYETADSNLSHVEKEQSELDSALKEELAALGPYAEILKRQGIDELDALIKDRQNNFHAAINRAISCEGMSCSLLEERRLEIKNGIVPPVAIFFGGGMSSGKSSVVKALSRTEFWKRHGSNAIVIEADAFKMRDPMFTALRGVNPGKASEVVHERSLEAAEELLLKAVANRRDVVIDGTMAWYPYIKQTIDFLRDNEYYYKRGAGFHCNTENGNEHEEYWVRSERRETRAASYQIEMVGVTIEPEVAVARGIIRRCMSGRGVPIRAQLQSHRLFSKNFMSYKDMFDASYLFDMSIKREESFEVATSEDSNPERVRRMIAIKPGVLFQGKASYFRILDEIAFSKFLRRSDLNPDADGASSLYCRLIVGAYNA